MSGSASIAAARRRRAGPQQDKKRPTPQNSNNLPLPPQLAQKKPNDPLELLKHHDLQIYNLEKSITDMVNDFNNRETKIELNNVVNEVAKGINEKYNMVDTVENVKVLLEEFEKMTALVNSQQTYLNKLNLLVLDLLSEKHSVSSKEDEGVNENEGVNVDENVNDEDVNDDEGVNEDVGVTFSINEKE